MKHILLILVIVTVVFSCNRPGADKKGSDRLTGDIRIDGSSTVYPITEAVAEEYRMVQPDVKIVIGISGTGGGFKKFGRGETDISDASRPIKSSEAELCQENNIDYTGLMIAYDGLAVVINPGNTWVDYLTVGELKMLWEPEAQGKIMKWNQIRSNWPDEEIHLFGPGVASGTFDYFTEAIVGSSGSSRGDFTASEDDNVLVQGIIGDKYGLGFFGLAYYQENREKLRLVPVDNGSGRIVPSLETVKNGSYSPLSRPLFIYVNSTAASRKEVISFIRFYLENAGSLAREVGYIPLPAETYEAEKQKFNEFLSGLGL